MLLTTVTMPQHRAWAALRSLRLTSGLSPGDLPQSWQKPCKVSLLLATSLFMFP